MLRDNIIMSITHKDILNQPNAKVSRLLTFLKLDNIRSSARSKRNTILESSSLNNLDQLYAKWFTEIEDEVNRALNDLNEASVED